MSPEPSQTAAQLEAEIARLERVASRQSTVLVADDVQTMRLLLGQALKSAGFSDMVRVADGEAAWKSLRERPCDLALVDWNMPRLDGLALLDRVRAHPQHRDMVYILVTAEHLDIKVMQAAEDSQDAYLTKPVSADKLMRRLELVLEKRLTQARALRHEALGQVDKAVDEFMAAAANRPRLHWPMFGLGALLARQGRLEEAQRCFQRVLEQDPEALGAMVELGRLHEAQGEVAEARKLFRRALALNPRFFKAYDALAESLAAQGQEAQALMVLEQAVDQQGGENAPRQEFLGGLRYALSRFGEAESAMAKALALKPNQNVAVNNLLLARTRLAQGRLAEALPALKAAAQAGQGEDDPQSRLDALLLMGATHLRAGDPEQAAKVFAELADPKTWPQGRPFAEAGWQRELGGVYLASGYEAEAQECFQKSLEATPGQERPDLAELCAGLGHADFLDKTRNEGVNRRLAQIEAHSRQGLRLVAAGRYQEAQEEYLKGLELDPSSGRLHFNLGKLLYRLGRQEEGQRGLVSAARFGLLARDWDLVGELVRIFASLGKAGQAKALLMQCLAQEPSHPRLRQALEALDATA